MQVPALASRLLLISSSNVHGYGFLDQAEPDILSFLGPRKRILFVPYAMFDLDGYELAMVARLKNMGLEMTSIHRAQYRAGALDEADALFAGGGNTFRLLKRLRDLELLDPIRDRVKRGVLSYIGSSAGSNIAGPTIRTTNDMPIVECPSLTALGLVPFQINTHYLDADPYSTHMGETREDRLLQYLEENATPVVGLREGSQLRIENGTTTLLGIRPARIFRRGQAPMDMPVGSVIDLPSS